MCIRDRIKAAESDITTLGINGYLQEDVLVASENTKASGTAVSYTHLTQAYQPSC